MANPFPYTQTFRFPNVCNFLTHNGLHENYVMSRNLIPQNSSMYVMFLSGRVREFVAITPNIIPLNFVCVYYYLSGGDHGHGAL